MRPSPRLAALGMALALAGSPGRPAARGEAPPDVLTVQAPEGGVATEAALADAVASVAPGGTIRLGPGTYPAGIVVSRPVTIEGAGAERTILDGRRRGRVLRVARGASVTLSGLTIANGSTVEGFDHQVEDGAGVLNLGDLRLVGCALRENVSRDDGGAICNIGTLSLDSCTLDGNVAEGRGGVGGAIYNVLNGVAGGGRSAPHYGPADVRIVRCTFRRNRAGDNGGAIWTEGRMSLQLCTISGNEAGRTGGGIRNNGTLDLLECTVARNEAAEDGGGLCNFGRVRTRNSLVGENRAPRGKDFSGPLVSRGGLLLQSADGVEWLANGPGDRVGVDPRLLPLARRADGPEVHELGPDSPAVDAAVEAPPGDGLAAIPGDDQAGRPRTSDGDGDGRGTPDIGASERVATGASPKPES